MQPRVDLPREEDPVVAEDADDRDGADEKEDAEDDPRAPGTRMTRPLNQPNGRRLREGPVDRDAINV